MTPTAFAFDNSYARDLPGFYVPWQPEAVQAPELVFLNRGLADELRLPLAQYDTASLAAMFSGKTLPEGATPIAQAYAGHQFGQFSPKLGDGRALLVGEVIDRNGRRRDIAFKGSGRTPFSRNGDGKAALGPMLREVLIGEAMEALGIPTTRALAVVATGVAVHRERPLPGAMLTRVAASHLRVGTFEFFAAHADTEHVRKLADYAIARHDPELVDAGETRYARFLQAVAERQAALIAKWMQVGFVHGVMNTDNMSIPGETIDYGPCAFMEAYDPQAVFSSIDEMGRYAYDKQPGIARWNLARLAETLLPLLADDEQQAVALATEVIDAFPERYRRHWLEGMCAKLGLAGAAGDEDFDTALTNDWLALLQVNRVDFTLAWRRLADAAEGQFEPLQAMVADQPQLNAWLARWQARCAIDKSSAQGDGQGACRAEAMRRVNPWLIPRNQRVEEALAAASDQGDLAPFEHLLAALRHPYVERPELARYAEPASGAFMADFRTFCGT